MNEKPDSEDFEEEQEEEAGSGEEVDLDQVIKELDMAKRRAPKAGDPAWRRLERLREEKHTAELVSDFEDYDLGDGDRSARKAPRH